MKTTSRKRVFRKSLKRHRGLWVCQPEPAVKTIIASGDSKKEAIEKAEMLGVMDLFTFFVSPEIEGGRYE